MAQPEQPRLVDPSALAQALGIVPGDLVALVGGGGKTSLMLALGQTLAAAGLRSVLTTTTRIALYELDRAPATCAAGDADRLAAALATHRCCLLAQPAGAGKASGVAPDAPQTLLSRPDVDIVIVEADGAAQRPVKAPAEHEPALPDGTTQLIVVVGIDALATPIIDVAHRPERVAALVGLVPHEHLSPQALARLLTHPQGGLKSLPPGARAVVFINKVETKQQATHAGEIAGAILAGSTVTRVVVGAIQDQDRPLAVYARPAP